ncbi:MAG: two-component sensor histidine kinase [Bacteroidota bacterium]|nr:MAG: two-component sensor histidine kinase [Bacteroidota bacterium]
MAQPALLDSLQHELKGAKEDQNKVLLLIRIGQEYEQTDLEKAKSLYRQARALGHKIGYPETEVKFISNYTFALNMQGRLDSSLYWNLKAIEEAEKLKNNEHIAKAYFNTGTSYQYLSDYQSAAEYYQKGLTYFEKIDNLRYSAQANDILQNLYNSTRQFDKAILHGKKAVAQFRNLDDPKLLAYSLTNLGATYGKMNLKDSSFIFHKEADEIAKKIGDEILIATTELNLADVYLWRKQYEIAKQYFQSVLQRARKNDLPGSETNALRGLSYYYQQAGDYAMAKKYAQDALIVSEKNNIPESRVLNLDQLSDLAYMERDADLGNEYATKMSQLQDSLLNVEIVTTTINIEKKYELDKKNDQIKIQEERIKQQKLFNVILIGGIVALLLVAFLSYRNYNNRKKLQQQRITELETEKQLLATQSLLQGQEAERSRIAKDLHDGLGGLLSGVKLQLGAMKGNLILSEENGLAFNRALDKLDESISEMRRVAHNMMPETLLHFGLPKALQDYTEGLMQQQAFTIECTFKGLEQRMSQSTEVMIYRMVQELINNAVKHSGASNILVQIIRHSNRQLNITVEDNGKGFIPEQIKQNAAGLRSVKSRVEYLNGKMDLQSEPGKGTSVYIECDLKEDE